MTWVAVARSADLLNGMAMPSAVAGVDLAIWRSAAGHVHAWDDRCPHRGMRLSYGFVRGETLACIYHGWQYGDDGGCVAIPAHPELTPPKSICAQTYPCREGAGLIWVAQQETDESLPEGANLSAIRSLEVACPAQDVADYFDQPLAPLIAVTSPMPMIIALQPRSDLSCMMHLLAAADQDPKAVSDCGETLRKQLEEVRP